MKNSILSSSLDEYTDLYLKTMAQCNIYALNHIKDAVNVLILEKNDVMNVLLNIDKQNSQLLSMVQENSERSHDFAKRIGLMEEKIDTLLSEKCERDKLLKILKDIQEVKNRDVSENEKSQKLKIVESCQNTYYSGNLIGTAESACKLCSIPILRNAHYFKTATGDTICYRCGKDIFNK